MFMRSEISPAYHLCLFIFFFHHLQSVTCLDLPVFTGSHPPSVPFQPISITSTKTRIDIPADCELQKWEKFPDLKTRQKTKTKEMKLGCELRPWLTGVYENGDIGTEPVNKGSGDSRKCKYFVMCEGGEEELCANGTVSVHSTMEWNSGNGRGLNRLSPVDLFCDIGAKQLEKKYKMAHKWKNFEKEIRKYQKFISNNENDPERPDIYVRVPLSFAEDPVPNQAEPNILAHSLYGVRHGRIYDEPWVTTSCGIGCHYGQHVTLSYQPKDQPMVDIFVKDTCNWISVCTGFSLNDHQSPCSSKKMIHIMIRNGFVVFMGSRRTQSPILLSRKSALGDAPVHIQLSRTNDDLTPYNGGNKTTRSIWAVTSMYRERAVGETLATDQQLLLMFDKEDCLYEGFGVRAKAEISVMVPVNDEEKKKEILEKNKYLAKFDGEIERPATVDPATEDITKTTIAGTPNVAASETTTPYNYVNVTADQKEVSPEAAVSKGKENIQGHLLWGIFYGWLAGSILAIVVLAPIFFLCRRTFFAFWYKQMYNRYQCDVSGTSGGITGVDPFEKTETTPAQTAPSSTVVETSPMESSVLSHSSHASLASQISDASNVQKEEEGTSTVKLITQ